MAISLATPRYIFGSSVACFSGALAYTDNQAIVYPAGSSLVAYNVDQREQKILMGSEHSRPVTALAITPNRRFIAVAEMGITDSETDRASIIIYDVQARFHSSTSRRQGRIKVARAVGIEFFVGGGLLAAIIGLVLHGSNSPTTNMYAMVMSNTPSIVWLRNYMYICSSNALSAAEYC